MTRAKNTDNLYLTLVLVLLVLNMKIEDQLKHIFYKNLASVLLFTGRMLSDGLNMLFLVYYFFKVR